MKLPLRILMLFCMTIIPEPVSARESGVIQLTVRILEGNTLLLNHAVYISQTLRYSHPERGTVTFELPGDRAYFQVEIPGKVIILPEGGVVPVPKDPNFVITILLGSRKEQAAFSEVNKKMDALSTSITNLSEYIRKSRELLDEYLERNNLILEQYKVEQFLEIQRQKQFMIEGQLKTIPLLTSTIDFYISRAKDFIDIMSRNKEKIFNDNGRILNEINQKITAYNEAYEKLAQNRETIINYVENYWGEYSLYDQTRELMDHALQNIHQLELLLANNLIEDINNYNERRRKHREKGEIITDIRETTDKIRIMIENLDKDKTRIVQKMKEYTPVLT